MKRWFWVLWGLGVALWAVALTTTFPVQIKHAVFPQDPAGIPIAKVLHVTAYAFLAGFAALLRPPGAWRWLILIFLLEHGVATEFIQAFVDQRTSSVNDIVIDHLGVALGLLLTWPWWGRRPD